MRGPKAMKLPASASTTSQWLRTATPDKLQAAVEAGMQIFVGVVGPSELLYLPSGYIRCDRAVGVAGEATTTANEVYGVRLTTAFQHEDEARPEFSAALADLFTLGKRNVLLSALVKSAASAASPAPFPGATRPEPVPPVGAPGPSVAAVAKKATTGEDTPPEADAGSS